MKRTQRERTVVRIAAENLRDRLRARSDVVVAHYWTECWLKPSEKRKLGRADAIVAALMRDGSIYTILVEAKSMRTFRALSRPVGCVTHFLVGGVAGVVLAIAVWWVLRGAWGVAAGFAAFIISVVLALWLFEKFRLLITRAPAIDQCARYPGNERWLAVAQDALKRSTVTFDYLLADCRKLGFGVLGVRRKGPPIVHLVAIQNHEAGDRLSEYVRGEKMLQELRALARGGMAKQL